MTSGPVAGVVDWLSRVALPFGASSRHEPKARAASHQAPSLPRTASHIFSVDVEEYFHALALAPCAPRSRWTSLPSRVEANTGIILDLLDRHNTKGTFFVVGWVAERCPQLVRRIAAAGHEVGCHSHWHRQVFTLSPDEFREDLRQSKSALEQVLGHRIQGYRAPGFSIIPGCEWAFDVMLEEGITYDSSLFPIVRPEYGYPNSPGDPYVIRRPAGSLLELPLTTTRIAGVQFPAAGGAYLRQLPYALIHRAFSEYRARGVPGMFYVHPWEVDPGQPRLPVPLVSRLRHYRGLNGMLGRLDRLLGDFKFTSVEQALDVPALRAAA
jgi:polysaccharide deacetylase family protein (PEP-CTERM system associated)